MRYLIFLLTIFLCVVPIQVEATTNGLETVAKLKQENITFFAKKLGSLYQDLQLDFKGTSYHKPFWINVTNPTYAPQIIYKDINNDDKNELIITLTKGYGTGVLDKDVHVFHHREGLFEVLVDNPLAIINKNVKSKLSAKEAEISIGGKQASVDISPLNIKPNNLFKDIAFGSIIDYEVKDHQLIAKVSAQISPASFIGEIVIVYHFKDKMYQAKSIEFQTYEA